MNEDARACGVCMRVCVRVWRWMILFVCFGWFLGFFVILVLLGVDCVRVYGI